MDIHSFEILISQLQGGMQTIDPVSVSISNAIIAVAVLFALNWGLLLHASGELRRTSLLFMQMNVVLALGVLTMLRLPSIAQVAGRNDELGLLAYLPMVPDVLAIYGMVLARRGKQLIRGVTTSIVEHYGMLALVVGVECILISTRQASLGNFIVLYSTLVAYICLMTVKDVLQDVSGDTFQKAVEGFPFFMVAVVMLLRVMTLDVAKLASHGTQDTAYITWGYFIALVLLNITMISQVTKTHIEKIITLAAIDNLTGAWLRKKITEKVGEQKARLDRHKESFSIIMFDIDHFKRINDTHGHAGGDEALQYAARLVTRNLRKLDSLGRWGGEEFLIVLPNTDLAEAFLVAEKLRKMLEASPLQWHHTTIPITASFGVAQCKTDMAFEVLVDQADKAMYGAKQSGRNRVHCHEAMPPNACGA